MKNTLLKKLLFLSLYIIIGWSLGTFDKGGTKDKIWVVKNI